MKKIVSYILAAIFIATSVLFFNSYFKKAKAATEEEVYNATNTYAVKSIEKNKRDVQENKKLIAIVMSMVAVLVAGVSCFNPNKETEAEYKARIKKELDAIPVEATGYKFEV